MYIKCIIFFSSSEGAKSFAFESCLPWEFCIRRQEVGWGTEEILHCVSCLQSFSLPRDHELCRPLQTTADLWPSIFWDNPVTLFWVVEWLWRKWWQLLLDFPMPLVHVHSVVSRTQNNAERVFALMPEKNAHAYCTMIRGMVKVPSIIYFHLEGLLSWWFFSTLILTWLGDAWDPECMYNVIWGWSRF